MAVLIGHGVAEVQRFAAGLIGNRRFVGLATAAVVLLAFVLGTRMLYLERDQQRMSRNTGDDGPAVTWLEVQGMYAIAQIVPPGARVLNDRGDGSAWMYPLTGVKPVAGHYDGTGLGETDVGLLESRFNQYARDPAVRAAVARLDVKYVMVGQGFLRGWTGRAPGLTNLDDAPYLEPVFRNADATVYRIVETADRTY